ncbi:MAG: hypothetical protein M1814_002356 [Vezdaea aestivalis]|nr:MAG: hypothetical protein M1814_002356 [Vezdaea aestivalis]
MSHNTTYTGLGVDKLVKDLGDNKVPGDTKIFATLSAAFGIVAGLAAPVPQIGGPAATVSSVFMLIDALKPTDPTPNDPTAELNDRLAQFFKTSEDQLENLVKTILGEAQKLILTPYTSHTAGAAPGFWSYGLVEGCQVL